MKLFAARCIGPTVAALFALMGMAHPPGAKAGGVTLITHGLNGNADGWVAAMAGQIPNYDVFPGTNFTIYKAYFFTNGGSLYLTAARVAGSAPAATDSGEIIVELDWSQLSDGNSYNTYQVAAMVLPALLDTNFISELGGHALAEMPLHLAGHSRGGSLICELSRLLGTNGVWVDHLTTLDPHPLNNDGFTLDHFLYSAVDAPAHTYSSVLFHDNYWQDIDFLTHGEAVAGAYVRQLTDLNGGYGGSTGEHSDVHLWYHGTIDTNTPATYNLDGDSATIDATMRTGWWEASEDQGIIAGFHYSLIGGGDRLSVTTPAGAGTPAIRDGYNQNWDLGAGLATNRTLLTTNNGNWPSLITVNLAGTNRFVQGQNALVNLYYQWARPAASNATVSFFLDDDPNPFNGNQKLLMQFSVPGTGANGVNHGSFSVPLSASNSPLGWHSLLAVISGGGRTRYLYAPGLMEVTAFPVTLDIVQINPSQFNIGVNGTTGQTVILQSCADFTNWLPLVTNTLSTNRWVYTSTPPGGAGLRFYRAVLGN